MKTLFFLFLMGISGALGAQWLEITTPHFLIIYEKKDMSSAKDLSLVCDGIYEKVCQSLGYFPQERIPLILRGETDETNGYFTPFPPSINLYLANAGSATDRGSFWLPYVLTHELTHYVQITKPWSWTGTVASWLGPSGTSILMPLLPGWIIEGITVYNESELTPRGRRTDPFFELQVKAPVLEDKFWSFDQAAYSLSSPTPYRNHYLSGYYLVNYLQTTYGPKTFNKIMDSWAAFPIGGWDRPLFDATGKTAREVWASMEEDLKAKWSDSSQKGEGIALGLDEDIYEIQNTPSTLWAYYKKNGSYELGKLESDGTFKSQFPVPQLAENGFSLSPDEKTLALTTWDNQGSLESEKTVSTLRIWDLVTGAKNILGDGYLYPSLNPTDSLKLAVIKRQGTDYILQILTTQGQWLGDIWNKPGSSALRPQWNPSGERLAFEEISSQGASLHIVQGENIQTLGPFLDRTITHPRWVDGKTLSFTSNHSGALAVYLWNWEENTVTGIIQDKIGAIGALKVKDSWAYLTYRSSGWKLFTREEENFVDQSFTPSVDKNPPTSNKIPGLENPSSLVVASLPIQESTYNDLPYFTAWSPYVESSGQLTKSILGLRVSWVSPLDHNTLALFGYYDSVDVRVYGSASYSWKMLGGLSGLKWAKSEEAYDIFSTSWTTSFLDYFPQGSLSWNYGFFGSYYLGGSGPISFYQGEFQMGNQFSFRGNPIAYGGGSELDHKVNVLLIGSPNLYQYPGVNYALGTTWNIFPLLSLRMESELRYSDLSYWSGMLSPRNFPLTQGGENFRWRVEGGLQIATPPVDWAWDGLGWLQGSLGLRWEKLGGREDAFLWDQENYITLEYGNIMQMNLGQLPWGVSGTLRFNQGKNLEAKDWAISLFYGTRS